ncbi:hypothetical protein HN873_038564, partial [Arachis hypogaea]
MHRLLCCSSQSKSAYQLLDKIEGIHGKSLNEAEVAAAIEEKETHAFEINPSQFWFSSTCLFQTLMEGR